MTRWVVWRIRGFEKDLTMQEVGAKVRDVGSKGEEKDIELDFELMLHVSCRRLVLLTPSGCRR